MKKYLLLALAATAFIYSCKDDSDEPTPGENGNEPVSFCDSVSPTYDSHISKIIETNCFGGFCHDNDSAAHGIVLKSYDQVKGASAYPAFLGAIKQEDTNFVAMPYGKAKLDDETIAIIECWIEKGTPEK